MDPLSRLLAAQDGVADRGQLLDLGLSRHDVAGLLRRRRLARVHPGVYVDHTGPPSDPQRQWAAVRACWPAALSHASVARPLPGAVVHVAVDRSRHLRAPTGVVVHRLEDLAGRVRWNASPPRLRLEDAVLLTASAARDDLAAVAVLGDACGSGATTAGRLLARLAQLPRLPRRRWLAAVLDDVATGTQSVLEHGYLRRVERPHGLPRGERQQAVARSAGVRASRRDVLYAGVSVVVELDGRLHHDDPVARGRDLDRDLAAAARRSEVTLRLGWRQVFETPCVTAALVGEVLTRRGWPGTPRRCPLCG